MSNILFTSIILSSSDALFISPGLILNDNLGVIIFVYFSVIFKSGNDVSKFIIFANSI